MKIFKIDECEWWVGATLEACITTAKTQAFGDEAPEGYYDDARELDDEALDRLKYIDTDEDESPTGEARTFREQLAVEIAQGGEFPRLFATTEY